MQEAIKRAIEGGWRRKPQEWRYLGGTRYITIPEVGGAFCYVDENDVPLVGQFRWYLKNGYAVTSIGGKRVKMHHLIMGKPPKGLVTDHISRNRLDNQRTNLRFVPVSVNAKNMTAKGYRKRGKHWEAYICTDYKQQSLGTFDTEAQAKAAYQSAKSAQLKLAA